jgi:hypothetical protein
MAVNFSVQFRINEKTQSRVLRLTDTSTGFTLAKGNFSVAFPDGSTRIKTDFTSPDINTPGAYIDILLVTDAAGAVLTGSYKIDFVALDGANTQYPLSRTFDFNWIKPEKKIVSGTDVLVPEVKFFDNTSYSPAGSFTGTVSRTFSTLMPSNTPQSGTNVIGVGNLINPIFSGNYYEGIYTVKSDISITYTHGTNSWLTLFYTDLLQEIIEVKRAPTQTQLIGFMNTYHAAIEAYEEKNDTQFNLLNEQYDLVVALYSHIIARYESGTLDGSEPLLTQLLDILRPYNVHTYTSAPLTPFTLDTIGTTGFVISNGTVSDNFSLGETLLFASGSAALVPTITNNSVIYTPTFGVTPNTFASGSDSRFHDPVTLGGSTNGLSLSTQQLSLATATTSAGGAMSAIDKAKLDGIAAGAQTGTVTSIGISMPSAFTVSNSPITTLGTIAITANGSSVEYIRGDGATGNFNSVARAAISLTTTGTAGAATYNSTTGVLNIPQYVGGVTSFNTRTGAITLTSGDVTTALTFTPYNATNPSNYIALTALSAGTGISYNSTTGVITNTITQYTDALARIAITLTTTGTSGAATYNSTTGVLNIPIYQGGVTSFNTRTGAITLISTDVTDALGYTPYNATNPAGYTTNVGTVTSVGGTGTVSGLTLTGSVTTSGNLTLGGTLSLTSGNITSGLGFTPENAANKGVAGGYASLDGGGLVPSTQLPSYVDDVLEFANLASLPATGETGKIYVTLDTNKIYRWSGSAYIEVSPTVGTIWGGITGTLANQTDLQSALDAKQDDITLTTTGTSGAATFIGNTLNIPQYQGGVTSFNTRTGAITLTSGDVTTALTFTPYDATNPSAYIALTALSAGAGISYNNTTGVISSTITQYTDALARAAISATGNISYNSTTGVISTSLTQYTDALARAAISLTTTGTSGAATYNSTTGVLNIPEYQGGVTSFNTRTGAVTLSSGDVTTALGFTPYNATNPSNYIALTALSSTATGLTYTNTTGVFSLTTGYAIPTTVKQSNWDDAYTFVAAFPSQTSNGGKYLTTDGSVLSWGTVAAGVTSFNTRTGAITLTSGDVTTALGYTPVTNARTLTINGTTYDLTANRSWTVSGTLAAGGTAGQILAKIDATDYNTQWIDNYAEQVKHDVKLGATIAKGKAVYVSSSDGTNMIVSAASNATEATSSKVLGLTETGGVTNDFVKVVTEGLVAGLDTSTATAGDPVWLGTGGNLIFGLANKPVAPAHLVYIGTVTRVNSNNGEIFVNVQNGFEFEELHNVLLTSKADKDLVYYDSATSLWKNAQLTTVLGYTPYNATNPNNYIALTALSSTATGLTYTNTTGVFSLTSGYVIPTTSSATNWDTAYTNRITTLTTTGSSGSATLSSNTLNIPTYTLAGLGGVPTSRTITINGTTFDLSADRTYTITPSASARAEQNFTATAGQTTFTITGGYVVGLVDVFINGARLLPTDYTATNGTTVVLGTGALLNDAVTVLNYTSTIAALPTSRDVIDYTATAAQTTFTVTGGYTVGLLDVYVNGSKLTSAEFTATNGTTFVLTDASVVGNQVQAIRYNASVTGVSGSGTANYVPKFTASQTVGNSLIFDNGTNVGIGTASPSAKLNLYNATTATQLIITGADTTNQRLEVTDGTVINRFGIFGRTNGDCGTIGTQSNHPLVFNTNNTERMRILAAGVSIFGYTAAVGTNFSPPVQVKGGVGTGNGFGIISGNNEIAGGIQLASSGSNSVNIVADPDNLRASSEIGFVIDSSLKMSITSAGDVLMGKSAENASVSGFQYRGAVPGLVQITRDGGETLQLWRYTSNGKMLSFYYNGSEVGSISSNTSSLPSDYNFKKDITDLSLGLNLIDKLRPVNYRHKIDNDNEPLSNGIIAQELEEALIKCGVKKNELLMLQHTPNEDKTQSEYWVDYTKMIPILIKAIQELSAKIDILENK